MVLCCATAGTRPDCMACRLLHSPKYIPSHPSPPPPLRFLLAVCSPGTAAASGQGCMGQGVTLCAEQPLCSPAVVRCCHCASLKVRAATPGQVFLQPSWAHLLVVPQNQRLVAVGGTAIHLAVIPLSKQMSAAQPGPGCGRAEQRRAQPSLLRIPVVAGRPDRVNWQVRCGLWAIFSPPFDLQLWYCSLTSDVPENQRGFGLAQIGTSAMGNGGQGRRKIWLL